MVWLCQLSKLPERWATVLGLKPGLYDLVVGGHFFAPRLPIMYCSLYRWKDQDPVPTHQRDRQMASQAPGWISHTGCWLAAFLPHPSPSRPPPPPALLSRAPAGITSVSPCSRCAVVIQLAWRAEFPGSWPRAPSRRPATVSLPRALPFQNPGRSCPNRGPKVPVLNPELPHGGARSKPGEPGGRGLSLSASGAHPVVDTCSLLRGFWVLRLLRNARQRFITLDCD